MGLRLRPHTYTQPKPLIPVAGKSIVGHMIDQLIEAGAKDFIFIIGYLGEKIQEYVENNYPQIKSTFVHQEQRLGLGHALNIVAPYVAPNEDILIVLGDIIFDADIKSIFEASKNMLGLKTVDDPRPFGVAELNDNGSVKNVIEKPKIPKSNLAITGIYKIVDTKALFEMTAYNIEHEIKTNDEFQLTDALMGMIKKGIVFEHFMIKSWYDCGKKEILLETNALLLKRLAEQHSDLQIQSNTTGSIIIQPVSIGKNCRLSHSIIGPFVSIGDNSTISNSIINQSIIGNYSNLNNVVLEQSIVGNDASIQGLKQSLNIGDDTEIDFNH